MVTPFLPSVVAVELVSTVGGSVGTRPTATRLKPLSRSGRACLDRQRSGRHKADRTKLKPLSRSGRACLDRQRSGRHEADRYKLKPLFL